MYKLSVALFVCVSYASAAALASTAMSVKRSQETCKDLYFFKSAQASASAATNVRKIVMTADSADNLKARILPQGATEWPATLTQGTHFKVGYHATAINCDNSVSAPSEVETSATGAYASGVFTFTFPADVGTNDGILCVMLQDVCTLTYATVAVADFVTTTADSSDGAADASVTMDVSSQTALTNTKMTSATFSGFPTFKNQESDITITPTFSQTAPPAADKLTVTMKGFTQVTGSVCSLNDVAYTATTADSADKIVITLATGKLLTTGQTIKCTKIKAVATNTAAQGTNALGVTFGTGTDVDAHTYGDAAAIVVSTSPSTAPTAAPQCAGGTAFTPPLCGSSSTLSVGLLSLACVVFSLFL